MRTLDIAKRLIDYGIHPPTIYFPLTVDPKEALMVEPTETESKATLDHFVGALRAILSKKPPRPPSWCAGRPTPPRSAGSTRSPPPAARYWSGRSNGHPDPAGRHTHAVPLERPRCAHGCPDTRPLATRRPRRRIRTATRGRARVSAASAST